MKNLTFHAFKGPQRGYPSFCRVLSPVMWPTVTAADAKDLKKQKRLNTPRRALAMTSTLILAMTTLYKALVAAWCCRRCSEHHEPTHRLLARAYIVERLGLGARCTRGCRIRCRWLDLVVRGATPQGGALCCDVTLVGPLARRQPGTADTNSAMLSDAAKQRRTSGAEVGGRWNGRLAASCTMYGASGRKSAACSLPRGCSGLVPSLVGACLGWPGFLGPSGPGGSRALTVFPTTPEFRMPSDCMRVLLLRRLRLPLPHTPTRCRCGGTLAALRAACPGRGPAGGWSPLDRQYMHAGRRSAAGSRPVTPGARRVLSGREPLAAVRLRRRPRPVRSSSSRLGTNRCEENRCAKKKSAVAACRNEVAAMLSLRLFACSHEHAAHM